MVQGLRCHGAGFKMPWCRVQHTIITKMLLIHCTLVYLVSRAQAPRKIEGLDNCLYPIRSIPPDSGGTYLTCITYVGGCGLLRSWAGSNVCASNLCSWPVKVG